MGVKFLTMLVPLICIYIETHIIITHKGQVKNNEATQLIHAYFLSFLGGFTDVEMYQRHLIFGPFRVREICRTRRKFWKMSGEGVRPCRTFCPADVNQGLKNVQRKVWYSPYILQRNVRREFKMSGQNVQRGSDEFHVLWPFCNTFASLFLTWPINCLLKLGILGGYNCFLKLGILDVKNTQTSLQWARCKHNLSSYPYSIPFRY